MTAPAKSKKGTFKQINEGNFVTNQSFKKIFAHLEEHGFVQDYSSKTDIYLSESDEINVITLDTGNRHRKLQLTTMRNGTVKHWALNVVAGEVIANPALYGASSAAFTFKWIPVAKPVLAATGPVQTSSGEETHPFENKPRRYQVDLNGDNGDTYRIVFDSVKMFEYFSQFKDGAWLKAAYSVLDKQGMSNPGDTVDVAITQAVGEDMITFIHAAGDFRHYRVCKNTGRALPVMSVPEFKTTTCDGVFFATMITGFKKKEEEQKSRPAPLTWIPYLNQYVMVDDEVELYRITDFDAVEKKFIVKKADSSRAKRGALNPTSVLTKVDGMDEFVVDTRHVQPYVLTYGF